MNAQVLRLLSNDILRMCKIALTGVLTFGASHTLLQAQSCAPPPAGLVGWWQGENNAIDFISGNSGILVGNITYAAGNVGHAFSSDGNGSAVLLGNPPSLRLQNFTIEAWVKRGSLTNASVDNFNGGIIFGYGSQGYNLAMFNDGQIFLGQVDVGAITSSLQITDLNWHHVAVTTTSGNVVFYVDGVGAAAGFYNPTFQFTSSVAIGARGDNFTASFFGLIDELSVYNRALTASDIQAIFNADSAGKCTGPIPPSISTQPTNQAVLAGNAATFVVAAAGSPQLSYQWQFNGAPLNGSTNFSLLLNNVQPTNVGDYKVIITNAYGSVTSSVVTLSIAGPPAIVHQPQGQSSLVGGTVVFTVDAAGSTPLSYQWRLGGTNLSRATNYSMEITNVQLTNAGPYTVVVTNLYGSITSAPAVLTLFLPPSIVTQPQSQTNYVGGNAYISVMASGSSNLIYQWRFAGTNNIAGATNPTLQLNNVQFSNGGNYSVVVTNPYGSIPSSNALLTVLAPQCAATPSGLVGWWQGESSARDAVSGNSGTLISNASYTAGQVGQAFNLDGNGDAVLIGNPTNLQLQNFTFEAWVKRGSPTQASLNNFNGGIVFGYGHAGYNLALLDDGTPLLGQVDSSGVFGIQKITDTAFHHLAVTKNGTSVVFYVDGIAGPATNYAATFQFTTPVAIGSRGDNFGASFFGVVDETSVYNRALSAAEIQSLYASTTLGKCAAPLTVLSQPTNQSVTVGGNVTFSILVSGAGPISIQWFQNGAPISGATNATLTLTDTTFFQTGTYSVSITGPLGTTNASNFVFSVAPPPLLVNGGFEQGNFTGWMTNDLIFPLYPLTVRSAGFDPAFGFFQTAPTEGNFCATHGFEGSGPGTISVAQDVLLPSGPAVLTFDYRAAWDMSNYSGSTLPRKFAVSLQPSGGGAPLHTFTLLTAAPGTVNPDTGPLSGSLDISAYSGRSLRVSFDATVPEFFTGPGFLQLDNVVLSYSILPPLLITQSGPNIVLLWPASTTNYTLQASGDLTMNSSWSAISTNLIVHGATNNSATLPTTPNPTFYRLTYP